jgi:two-component system LytT family response regulator
VYPPEVPVGGAWCGRRGVFVNVMRNETGPLRGAQEEAGLRLMIVQDLPADRVPLANLCRSQDLVEHVEEAESGADALRRIDERPPDVVLLDCELTDMSGFDLLERLPGEERPASIFMAPDERHALRAIAASAADYLIKPIHARRMVQALQRARIMLRCPGPNDATVPQFMSAARTDGNGPSNELGIGNRLVGERNGKLYFILPDDVEYIEAAGNYVTIHSGDRHYISRDSLKRLTPLLQSQGFVRINRSVAVNLRRVDYAEREGQGVLGFVLQSGVRLVASRGMCLGSSAELSVARRRRVSRTRKGRGTS